MIGSIIIFLDWITSPKGLKRDANIQTEVDSKTSKLKLYQFYSCPFCVKVRRAMKKMSLNIETRDAKNNPQFREELETHGGRIKVPCLRIEDDNGGYTWMYESTDIVKYLSEKYS
jgi:glutathione S-transferase